MNRRDLLKSAGVAMLGGGRILSALPAVVRTVAPFGPPMVSGVTHIMGGPNHVVVYAATFSGPLTVQEINEISRSMMEYFGIPRPDSPDF